MCAPQHLLWFCNIHSPPLLPLHPHSPPQPPLLAFLTEAACCGEMFALISLPCSSCAVCVHHWSKPIHHGHLCAPSSSSSTPLSSQPPKTAPHLADAFTSLPLTSLSVLNCLRHDPVLRSDVTRRSRDWCHLMLSCFIGSLLRISLLTKSSRKTFFPRLWYVISPSRLPRATVGAVLLSMPHSLPESISLPFLI